MSFLFVCENIEEKRIIVGLDKFWKKKIEIHSSFFSSFIIFTFSILKNGKMAERAIV